MALPKLVTPEFETVIPSTKEPIKFRPFLVKEEKVLYMALESGEEKDIYNAVMSILDSCVLTPDIDNTKYTSYDLEFLFLKLRSKSVGEKIDLSLSHMNKEYLDKCSNSTKVQVNIDDIQIEFNDKHNNTIEIEGGVGIKLRDPKTSMLFNTKKSKNEIEQLLDIVCDCIELFYDADNVYEDFTKEEAREFIENLTKDNFEKIVEFFNTLPKLAHDITYTCPECNETETIKIEGMQSFFT
ncbi:MAG: hypothetical protein P1U56_26950 [Saprospiraceae bacterium]|jgi:hypothetical protein|nr:hypothetical protein [Saprospiraceae bacterium]